MNYKRFLKNVEVLTKIYFSVFHSALIKLLQDCAARESSAPKFVQLVMKVIIVLSKYILIPHHAMPHILFTNLSSKCFVNLVFVANGPYDAKHHRQVKGRWNPPRPSSLPQSVPLK